MLQTLAARLRKEVHDVKRVVVWQESLRNALYPAPGTTPARVLDAPAIDALRNGAPLKLQWQVFDHCAVMTRTYALFEQSVRDLVGEYLSVLPRVTNGYSALHERLRQQHRIGVGQILTKWSSDNSRFTALSERDIAAGLADGVRGTPYTLLQDAFLLRPENFRAGAIRRIFSYIGFDDAFSFVSKSLAMEEFVATRLAASETAESFLNAFVRARNEVSHSNGSNLASASELLNFADFTVIVVEELENLLRSTALRLGIEVGLCVEVGKVAHVYSDCVVGIRAVSEQTISVGDSFYAGKRTLLPVVVQSLQIKEESQRSIRLKPGLEFGAKIDRELPDGAPLLKWRG